MEISRLRVGDEAFLVSSMIERCPKSMMLRELVKNALEAAERADAGGRSVVIRPLMLPEGRKLSIWNSGPGMSAEELRRMCDIASSIGKSNGLDQNFGMGAKVASLPSNQLGLRYRSCKNGRVHEVMMGKRDGVYGRLLRPDASGALAEVLDVTDAARAEGAPTEYDWTEVTLLGNRAEQDTVADPYDGAPGMSRNWIAEELYARFFTLAEGVELVLQDGCHDKTGHRAFVPLAARLPLFARHEAVAAERGIVLHYIYDAPDPDRRGETLGNRDTLSRQESFVGLLYRGEIYDRRAGGQWTHESPLFGVPFGSRNFSVLIHLPDDYPLLPDGYRQFLRHAGNLQHHILVRDYAALVTRNRPGWMLELLGRFAPDAQHTEAVRGGMAALFASLGVRRRWWPPGDGTPPPHGGDGIEYEVAPQIVPLRDLVDIRERGLERKAARFYRETHQLFLNTDYEAIGSIRDTLEREFADEEDAEAVRARALAAAEEVVTLRIARKLVFGLAKRDVWPQHEVDQATSMFSLTLAADDPTGVLDEARAVMRGKALSAGPDEKEVQTRFMSAMKDLLALGGSNGGGQKLELLLKLG